MQGTHVIANVYQKFFFFSNLKIATINPQSQYFGQEMKNILHHYFCGEKIIQNCLKIDVTH